MLLIDDDQPEVRQGREHGGARTNYDACRTFADAVPLVESLTLREVGVEHGDLVIELREPRFKTANSLRREGNFRDEDEDGFAEIKGGLRGLEINFGFTAACYS